MGIGPGSLAWGMPPAADDQVRRQRDLERQARENAAARSLAASQIGAGGLLISDGGSIRIEDGGDLLVDGDATFNGNLTVPAGSLNTAGSLAAGGNVTAGGSVTAVGTVQGAAVVATGTVSGAAVTATGNVSSGGDVNATGYVRGGNIYGNILSVDYRVVYVTGVDGALGHVPSSAKYKTDIHPANLDLDALFSVDVHTFKYKDAIAAYGSHEAAPTELGLIAEEVDAAGLGYLVYRGADGSPEGVAYERLGLPLLAAVKAQRAEIAELRAALVAAGLL